MGRRTWRAQRPSQLHAAEVPPRGSACRRKSTRNVARRRGRLRSAAAASLRRVAAVPTPPRPSNRLPPRSRVRVAPVPFRLLRAAARRGRCCARCAAAPPLPQCPTLVDATCLTGAALATHNTARRLATRTPAQQRKGAPPGASPSAHECVTSAAAAAAPCEPFERQRRHALGAGVMLSKTRHVRAYDSTATAAAATSPSRTSAHVRSVPYEGPPALSAVMGNLVTETLWCAVSHFCAFASAADARWRAASSRRSCTPRTHR